VWCFAWSPLGKTLHALTAADRLCSKSTLEPSTNGRRWLFCALPAAAHGYSLWASISCVLEAWHIPLAFTANFGRSRDSALQVCMLCRSKQSVFLFLELPHPVHWSCGPLYLVAKAFRHTAGDCCSSNQCSQSMSIDSAVGGSLGRTMYHVPLYMVLQPLGCKRAWWRHSKYSQNDQVHLLTADIGVLTTPSCFDIQFPGGKYIIIGCCTTTLQLHHVIGTHGMGICVLLAGMAISSPPGIHKPGMCMWRCCLDVTLAVAIRAAVKGPDRCEWRRPESCEGSL